MIAAGVLAALLATAAQATPASTPAPAPAITVSAVPSTRTPGDPHERFNRRMFAAQQRFDARLLRPAARGYARAVPRPLRDGIRNFFANLGEPIVFLNYMLQLKPGKAAETAGRFVFNSTLGIAGLFDVAKGKAIRLPHRPNGFGDTLGFYGVRPGAYLFLPFVGPTTVRDLFGGQADGLVLPLAVGHPFDRLEYQIPHAVLTGLDRRAEADADLQALFDGAVDPYATLRSAYLQDRAGEIAALKGRHGAVPQGELDDPLTDPAATPTPVSPVGPPATPTGDTPAAPQPSPN